ncbi:ATP synthase F1 subunit epsilon [Ilumatobacter nonamiensis]|uniref:ATP synthase F1 subunit epsilon n=1 Tax=Ilumatobacter nonamiensis TaxID=467093 RepID=UPI00058AE1B7|nr:ATP synthase F1 subunit epsilon [Ilumatobacter nonamiensis]
MAEPMQIDLVSPEEVVFSGEANMVITRTDGGGEIAFQSGHAPFVGALVENHTRIYLTDGKIQDIAVHRGFIEVSGGSPTRISLLSDKAELAEDIDVEQAKADLERHELTLKTEEVEANIADAVAGKARAIARLKATGTGFTA